MKVFIFFSVCPVLWLRTLFMFPTYPPTFFLHTIVRFESSLLGMVVGGHWKSDSEPTFLLMPPAWAFYVNTSINKTFGSLSPGMP